MTVRSAPPPSTTNAEESIVFVVDDDASVREALSSLFRSVGLQVETFGSAHEFLQSKLPNVPSCLILDIRLPRLSGLDFQAELVLLRQLRAEWEAEHAAAGPQAPREAAE